MSYEDKKEILLFYVQNIKTELWSFCAVFVQRRSLVFLHIPLLDITPFGLTGHLQVYSLLWLRILPLTVMRFSFLLL
jgi:hypothetical protein